MSAEKKLRAYLTPQELREQVVDWSINTLRRRIKEDGFPAINDGKGILIPIDKMHQWFKKREVQN